MIHSILIADRNHSILTSIVKYLATKGGERSEPKEKGSRCQGSEVKGPEEEGSKAQPRILDVILTLRVREQAQAYTKTKAASRRLHESVEEVEMLTMWRSES